MRVKPMMWNWSPAMVEPKWQDLARRLVCFIPLWEGGGTPIDIVGLGRPETLAAGWSWSAGHWGWGLETDGSGALTFNDPNHPRTGEYMPNGGPFTVVTVLDGASKISDSSEIIGCRDWRLKWEQYNATDDMGFTKINTVDLQFTNLATPAAGTPTVFGATVLKNENVRGYLDGEDQLDTDTNVFAATTADLALSDFPNMTIRYAGIMAFADELSNAEHRMLAADPLGMWYRRQLKTASAPPSSGSPWNYYAQL